MGDDESESLYLLYIWGYTRKIGTASQYFVLFKLAQINSKVQSDPFTLERERERADNTMFVGLICLAVIGLFACHLNIVVNEERVLTVYVMGLELDHMTSIILVNS